MDCCHPSPAILPSLGSGQSTQTLKLAAINSLYRLLISFYGIKS
ncbi:hypothetical protein [[Phormidium] sp. ETS-05]|nr:hypothetical protein [[Phormidium] sp. ETS-05]